jgi:hypothetical protein
LTPLWRLRDLGARRLAQDPRWAAVNKYLPWFGEAAQPLPGAVPVVAVEGARVHLLLLILVDRLPEDLKNALAADPIAIAPETVSALDQLCWHLPRWLSVLVTRTPRRATDLQLFSVDSWDDSTTESVEVHRVPPRVAGRSLLLSAVVALVSDLVARPLPVGFAFSADVDFATGRLAPVDHLARKREGLRVLLPNATRLLTAPADRGSDIVGVERLARVEQVLTLVGLSEALVEHLFEERDRRVRQLVEAALAGRSLLHSWSAIAEGARKLLERSGSQDEETLLRFVRAVALRHDAMDPLAEEMPAADRLCAAAQSVGLILNPDEVRAHWLQHYSDLIVDPDATSLAVVRRRAEEIEANVQRGAAVWPAALKLLGAWARYQAVLGGPRAWADARRLSVLACESWLHARLGHEASYPLSEVWRLTGALPYDEQRYREAAELHERWAVQPGAVTADNYAFVILSRARAWVTAPEAAPGGGSSTASGDLERIREGKISPDLPFLRAAATRWLMSSIRSWPADWMTTLREQDPLQHYLARLDIGETADGEAQMNGVTECSKRWFRRCDRVEDARRGSPY